MIGSHALRRHHPLLALHGQGPKFEIPKAGTVPHLFMSISQVHRQRALNLRVLFATILLSIAVADATWT
jgi:hypothetical protein